MLESTLIDKRASLQRENSNYFVKLILMGLLSAATAFIFSWQLDLLLHSDGSDLFVSTTIFAGLFLIIFLLQSIFIRDRSQAAFWMLIDSAALTAVFIVKSYYAVLVLVLICLILYWAKYSGDKVAKNNLRLDFWQVSRTVLPKAIIAIALVAGIFSPIYLKTSSALPFSSGIFETILASSGGIVGKFFPGVDPNSSISKITRSIAENQISQMPEVNILPQAYKDQLIKTGSNELYNQISGFLGIAINPSLKLSDALFEAAKEKFMALPDSAKNLIFILIGALIFAVIETLSLPIRIIISAIAFVFFKILIYSGFAKISHEDAIKEIIII